MPRIPRPSEPRPLNVSGMQVPRTAQASQKYDIRAKIADQLLDFTLKYTAERNKALTRSYASNAASEDLLATNQKMKELQLNAPEDGADYALQMQNFLRQRMQLRQDTAPTDEAYILYENAFSPYRTRSLINAQNYENKLRVDSIHKKRQDRIDEAATELGLAPDFTYAVEQSRLLEKDISEGTRDVYTPAQAASLIEKSRALMSKSLFDGFEATNNPEMTLAILTASLPEDRRKSALKHYGFENDQTLPYVNPEDAQYIVESLSPGDANRRLKYAVQQIKNRQTENLSQDKREVKDLAVVLRTTGPTPETTVAKKRLFDRLGKNPKMKLPEEIRLRDEVNLNEALGAALKRSVTLGLDETDKAEDYLMEEIGRVREELGERIQDVIGGVQPKEEIDEAVRLYNSDEFNAAAISNIKTSFNAAFKEMRKQMLSEPAIFWNNKDQNIDRLQDMLLGDYTNVQNRYPVFEAYANALDNKFERMKMVPSDRKYLTPELSKYYSNLIRRQANAEAGMDMLYSLSKEFGPKANKIFAEMGQRNDLPPKISALTYIDPRQRQYAEQLYGIMLDKEGFERIENQFDKRFGDQIELTEDIQDAIGPLRSVIQRTDPSGRSLYITDGLQELMRVGSIADTINGDSSSVTKAFTKWKNVLSDPYKIIDRSGSIVFTKWDTVRYTDNVESFLSTFSRNGANALLPVDGLDRQLIQLGLSSGFAPEPRWLEQEKELKMPGAAMDKLRQRLNTSEFVMNPTFDGLILMHTDTGTRRPFKDSKGNKIEIPINRLNEIKAPSYRNRRQIQNSSGIRGADTFNIYFGDYETVGD